MSLRLRNNANTTSVDEPLEISSHGDTYSLVSKRQRHKKWRLVFTAISFTRALISLSKKAVHINKEMLQSISYVAIDINADDCHTPLPPPISDVDDRKTLITSLVREKRLESLIQVGGIKQVARILQIDENTGINGNESELLRRKNIFGENCYEKQPAKGFLSFVYEAMKDTTMIILFACAVLSLSFGIKQHGVKDGWYDGGSIIFAIFLVVVVSSVSNFKQNRQFEKLSDSSTDNIKVEVVRDGGRRQPVSIFDIVVGDIVCLKIGDQIPADGLFLKGHSLKVDESSMTGESDHVDVNNGNNPFMLSGTKVTDGYGSMLVTAVGMNTAWGEMMSSITRDLDEQTPLQVRLNKLTSYIGKIGLIVAISVLLVLLIRYFTGNTVDEKGQREFNSGGNAKSEDIMNAVVRIVAAAVTIVVVAIPEGLPLAVTLTLAYSMKRMMGDNALVRKLSACETMGSATTICTDKTGTLTLNEMKVTEFWLGERLMNNDISSSVQNISFNVYELMLEGVGLNTIGNVYKSDSTSVPEISGSPTEKAILSWAVLDLGMDLGKPKKDCEIIHVESFNSEKKRSGVSIRRAAETSVVHTHWKGAAEMILSMCSHYYDIDGVVKIINQEEIMKIGTIIKDMAAKSLRCIAFAHREVSEENGQNCDYKLEETGLTLLALVGLKDPCRPGVRTAVESCKKAGVKVKMITGDNIYTARAIAIECGIIPPNEVSNKDDVVIEGVEFKNYSPEERMAKIDKITVMARSSPFDKLLMVQCLKQKGHVVAVTGDGTNDAPALKEADVGLSMGIQGTEVAKESSDIVILDDNFSSVVTVLRWGRCVYNNIQKFIQFQLTVNVAALVVNFIAAVSSGNVPLTAIQLLWVNLIMDTLGALALATEGPTNELMKSPPVGWSKPLITNVMWRNLISQALYQVTVLLVLQFKGMSIFSVDVNVKNTVVFNAFVLCQIFNEFNAREMEKKNVFEGLHKNKLFIGIVGITMIMQVIMVEFLNRFANTKRLNLGQWSACVGIAAMSWLIGWLVKYIPVPSEPLLSFFSKRRAPAL